mgnify:CR=1 FL=1
MMKPSLPQGFRDFGAETVRKRNFIFNTIRNLFELYGFQPLETPAVENLETLTGKYGEEGDKLIFKILNNGLNDPRKSDKARIAFENILLGKNDKEITERALKYDLTIPFARYVAMHHGQLAFPFKRYQIQPVWRADRPQRGRYREFFQCDADVVGSLSLQNEVELSSLYSQAFAALGIPVDIRINNRKILAALAEFCGGPTKMMDITIAIDKLDNIGMAQVKEELVKKGFHANEISIIEKYLHIKGSNEEKLQQVKALLGSIDLGIKGIGELEYILKYQQQAALPAASVDFTLARGLNYYTGTTFEVKAKGIQMGSIGGGGRYDDLTGLFGVPNIPGVGISFGVDRIYDVMEELKLFPDDVHIGTQALFFNLGEAESRNAFSLMQKLRATGIRCELFHESGRFDKQFKYAEKKNIQFVVIIGSKELNEETCTIRNLLTGEQETIPQSAILQFRF